MVRAKFQVQKTSKMSWGGSEITMNPVSADEVPENQRFHKYTPSGTLIMSIDNPTAEEFFKLGKSYYLDFSNAE